MTSPAPFRRNALRISGLALGLALLPAAVPVPHARPAPQQAEPAGTTPTPAASAPATAPAPPPGIPLATTIPLHAARLPGFAAELANRPLPDGPAMWQRRAPDAALAALATARPDQRQAARWDYGVSQVARGRGPEALGALDTMLEDDPDMALVPAFRLARGAALTLLNRNAEALDMLTAPLLLANPEACLWRLLAQVQAERPRPALAQLHCALPAINSRRIYSAATFIRAAASAAIETGQYAVALGWLRQLPDDDGRANLLRGQALLAQGNLPEGRLRLQRVKRTAPPPERMEAELALIEGLSAHNQMPLAEALRRTDRLLFLWHGGRTEDRALHLAYELAEKQKNGPAMLRYGGLLLRYGNPGARGTALLAACQQQLFAILRPDNGLPLPQAAGLFWDNRDLAPTGPDGDRLLDLLAGRLAQARLYEGAADLLAYQMTERAEDVEKGPVSEKVARFYLLAGLPDKALAALRATASIAFPPAIDAARRKVQAVALYQLGHMDEAMAILADMPDTTGLREEMLWRRRDWSRLADGPDDGAPPAAKDLSPVAQAVILRQAVALAMTGQEEGLARLRARYAAAFARSPSAAAFALLTGPVEAMSGDGLARAMAAIPAVSVAGDYDDMLDARAPAAPAPAPKPKSAAAKG